MKFLAVDTANEYMCVLAHKDGKTARAFLPDCTMRHSTELLGQVEQALAECGLTLAECDFFAAVVGAGSFTGIRIGVSAVKGFCLAFGKPALPVTSFEVAAYNALGQEEKTLCLVDALHGSYYACGFDGDKKVILPPAYLSEDEVLKLTDEGYALRALQSSKERGLEISKKEQVAACNPDDGLLAAVLAKAQAGEFGELNALYVRKSSAELNLEK